MQHQQQSTTHQVGDRVSVNYHGLFTPARVRSVHRTDGGGVEYVVSPTRSAAATGTS